MPRFTLLGAAMITAGLAIIIGLSAVIVVWDRLSGEHGQDCGDPVCTPSRKPITARQPRERQPLILRRNSPQRTGYPSRRMRWFGLERSVKERSGKEAEIIRRR